MKGNPEAPLEGGEREEECEAKWGGGFRGGGGGVWRTAAGRVSAGIGGGGEILRRAIGVGVKGVAGSGAIVTQ